MRTILSCDGASYSFFSREGVGTEDVLMWRSIVADCATVLHTPIGQLEEMCWADVIAWHQEAVRLSKARIGRNA